MKKIEKVKQRVKLKELFVGHAPHYLPASSRSGGGPREPALTLGIAISPAPNNHGSLNVVRFSMS